ncbi:iron permease FTR1 family protein [Fictibacillus macauensis ZFHKF-1]|uniref:Iron permease FTR1 family protein n=1 Tax=Fictibacillus macauensis ZFHKF-1 TaxID=1196324 RepID=I8J5B6_9BACL|nr:FTR1 family protein [Fictibacillus macauensis]EIT86966.1 iron permease FTR1 family protein [Fictibacillus macauensis ZFHKF-1]
MKKLLSVVVAVLILLMASAPISFAADNTAQVKTLEKKITETIAATKAQNFPKAESAFRNVKQAWTALEAQVRKENLAGYSKIKSKMAAVSLSLLNKDQKGAEEALQNLNILLTQYEEGALQSNPAASSSKHMSITDYLGKLAATKQSLNENDFAKAKAQAEELNSLWLSVEGNVVGKSQTVYNNSEKRLVMLTASIATPDKKEASLTLLTNMENDLKPLANSTYGIWDAALIPLREGLEALLIIGALLTFTKRDGAPSGGRWVWTGTTIGILASLGAGFLVSFALSASAFGQNNFLINGWSGVIASLMLLYVSYWLHRNSNVSRWNAFVANKTKKALTSGKLFSLGLIAFLAVLREGIETVIFLIGMANQMSTSSLVTGILIGFGLLIVLGFIMLKLSVRLPLKPFFIISSAIVFYMCLKFMGSGIHSLQLSGLVPSVTDELIPSIDALGVYPSWYSFFPQVIIVLIAVSIVMIGQLKKKKIKLKAHRQQEAS